MKIRSFLNCQNSKIRSVQLLGVLVFMVCLVSFEYYLLINKSSRYFQSILDKAEQEVFEGLKQDFSKLIHIANGSKMRLRFLHNITLEKPRNQSLSVTKDEAFIRISYPKNIIVISVNEIKANLANLLFKEITFDFGTKELSDPGKFTKSYEILSNLFVHYQISQHYFNKTNIALLLESLQRGVVVVSLFVLLHLALFRFYQRNTLSHTLKTISELEDLNKNLQEKCNNLEGERELIGIIYARHVDESQYKLKIAEICKSLKRHFNKKNVCINITNLVGAEVYLEIPESEVAKILTTIIFYKKSLAENLKMKLVISSDNLCINFSLRDNGFTLTREQLISYANGAYKPHYVMEWIEMLNYMKINFISCEFTSTKKSNLIRMQIPINRKLYNVWNLKDYLPSVF